MIMNSYAQAESINSKINFNTEYRTDWAQYNTPEFWCEAGKYGDCEDYALAKRNALLKSGWSMSDVNFVVCVTETGEGHGVLLVKTDKGNYILDNRYDWPMLPKSLPYTWKSILCDGKWSELQGFV